MRKFKCKWFKPFNGCFHPCSDEVEGAALDVATASSAGTKNGVSQHIDKVRRAF